MDTGTLANKNYVTIPSNAANAAGAMVLANHILSTENQLIQADPERWGWMLPTDVTTWTDGNEPPSSHTTGARHPCRSRFSPRPHCLSHTHRGSPN